MSLGLIVTRFPWIAHRFTLSKIVTRNASEASCKARMTILWKRRPGLMLKDNFPHQTLKRKFPNQKFGGLLIPTSKFYWHNKQTVRNGGRAHQHGKTWAWCKQLGPHNNVDRRARRKKSCQDLGLYKVASVSKKKLQAKKIVWRNTAATPLNSSSVTIKFPTLSITESTVGTKQKASKQIES